MPSDLLALRPYVPQIEDLIDDDQVTGIFINAGGRRVFVERAGIKTLVEGRMIPEQDLIGAMTSIAHTLTKVLSTAQPFLEARLEDGSRISGVLTRVATSGAILTIRKFPQRYTLAAMVANGTLTEAEGQRLMRDMERRHTMLICGGAGTGKTTLVNALAAFIPYDERVIVIEDTSEIDFPHPDCTHLEAQEAVIAETPSKSLPEIRMTRVLEHTLRQQPDRIILGEVRGAEAWDLITLLNTGHQGSLCTIHANAASLALDRLVTLAMQAQMHVDYDVLLRMAASVIDTVVAMERTATGQRRVKEILTIGQEAPAPVRHLEHKIPAGGFERHKIPAGLIE